MVCKQSFFSCDDYGSRRFKYTLRECLEYYLLLNQSAILTCMASGVKEKRSIWFIWIYTLFTANY